MLLPKSKLDDLDYYTVKEDPSPFSVNRVILHFKNDEVPEQALFSKPRGNEEYKELLDQLSSWASRTFQEEAEANP